MPSRSLVLVVHSMGGGGAERVTANLANHWAGKGWLVTVVTLAPLSADFYQLHPAVCRISLNLAGDSPTAAHGIWQNFRRVTALRRTLRTCRADIALGVMSTANVILALAALGLGLRVIGSEHVHPPTDPLSPLWERLRRYVYRQLDALTVLTSQTARWFEAHAPVRRIVVIPNAAPWPLPIHEPIVSPAAVCRAGRPVLLAVGRLSEEKGLEQLLEAFSGLMKKHPEWDLVILGEGPLRDQLERQVMATQLGGRAFLPGRVGNLAQWYERADLYVMSSRYEGFGNTLAEALVHGLPSVSFDCDTGPREIIRHEIDGLLVPPDDVAGLAAALDRLMGDAGLRNKFAARAVEARERFSIERIAEGWEALFDEIEK